MAMPPRIRKSKYPIDLLIVALSLGEHPTGGLAGETVWFEHPDELPLTHTFPYDDDVGGMRYAARYYPRRIEALDDNADIYVCGERGPIVIHGWTHDEEGVRHDFFWIYAKLKHVAAARRRLRQRETEVMRCVTAVINQQPRQQELVFELGALGPDQILGDDRPDGGDQG